MPTALMLAAITNPALAAGSKLDGANLHSCAYRACHKADCRSGHENSAEIGLASFYWQSQRVSSGGRFNSGAMTAAHRSLPFGTRVRVTHTGSGRSVDVRINDRGPFTAGRIIDLSKAAADLIGITAHGIARVKVTVLGR